MTWQRAKVSAADESVGMDSDIGHPNANKVASVSNSVAGKLGGGTPSHENFSNKMNKSIGC